MSFDLVGSISMFSCHYMAEKFLKLADLFELDCPQFQKLEDAHENLYDIVIEWNTGDITALYDELSLIKKRFEEESLPGHQIGNELHTVILEIFKICKEAVDSQGNISFRCG